MNRYVSCVLRALSDIELANNLFGSNSIVAKAVRIAYASGASFQTLADNDK